MEPAGFVVCPAQAGHGSRGPALERAKQIAVILHTSLDYLTGLEDAYTVKLPGLSKEQREALNDFLRVFVEIK